MILAAIMQFKVARLAISYNHVNVVCQITVCQAVASYANFYLDSNRKSSATNCIQVMGFELHSRNRLYDCKFNMHEGFSLSQSHSYS